MAKRKVTTVVEGEIDDALQKTPDDPPLIDPNKPTEWIPAPSEEETGLQNFLDGLGEGEIVIKIYKFDATTNRPRFMADVGLEAANEAFCQANWGEGRYQLKAYKEGKHQGSRTVLVGPPLQKAAPPQPIFLPPVKEGLDAATQIQLEMIRQEMQSNREFMKLMLESMHQKDNAKSGSMELAEIMVMLKGVMPAPVSGPNILETITQAIPLVKELIGLGANGGAAPEKTWIDHAKDFLPEVGSIMKTILSSRNGAQPPAPAQTPPAAAMPLTVEAPVLGLPPDKLEQIRWYFSMLKGRANAKSNPLVFVDVVMETLDDEQSLAICRLLDKSYEEIAVIDPEILDPIKYRPWFEEFFGGLRDAIIERNSPAGAGSDDNEPPADAGTGDSGVKGGPQNP